MLQAGLTIGLVPLTSYEVWAVALPTNTKTKILVEIEVYHVLGSTRLQDKAAEDTWTPNSTKQLDRR